MTVGELRDEIFALNWENASSFDGDKRLLCFAINRAVSIVSSEVRPILGELIITQDLKSGTGTEAIISSGYARYDLKALTAEGGKSRFRSVAGICWENKSGLPPEGGFRLERSSQLCISDSYIGEVRVIYKRAYTPVNMSTDDGFELELDEEVCVLVPLLAAYFVWLDDDRSRAQEYYNQYELRRDRLVAEGRSQAATVVIERDYMGM